jgi:LacI family transcriptional regulator
MSNDKKVIAIASFTFAHGAQFRYSRLIESHITNEYTLHRVSVYTGEYKKERGILENLLETIRPYALICICIKPAADILDPYIKAGIPVVLIDEEIPGFTSISTDNVEGGYIAAQYLIKTGRKNIGIVSGRLNVEGSFTADKRFEGFKKALGENNMSFDENNFFTARTYSHNDGVEAMKKIPLLTPRLDAIFCPAGDICASGILSGAAEANIIIPRDLALIGYDDNDLARCTKPPLTTVMQPMDEATVKALECVTKNREKSLNGGETIILKPQLIVRESA